MSFVLAGLLVFVSAAILDVASTRYVLAAGAGRPHAAARYSALMWCASMIGTVAIVRVDLALAPFELVGLYIGAWWAVDRSRRKPA